jgi:uncharacterized protein
MKKAMRSIGLVLLLLIVSAGGCSKKHPTRYVLDTEEVLTPTQHRSLDSLFRAHEAHSGNEIALVTHPTFLGKTAKEFAVAFGDSVGVGKKETDNGVVIAFSRAKRSVFIAIGWGIENVMPDKECQRIVDSEMLPRFKKEDYFGGLFAGSRAVVEFLERPENRIR